MAFSLTSEASSIDLQAAAASGQMLLQAAPVTSVQWLNWCIGCAWSAAHADNRAYLEWSPDLTGAVGDGSWYLYAPPALETGDTLRIEDAQHGHEPRAGRYRLRWVNGGATAFTANAFRSKRV